MSRGQYDFLKFLLKFKCKEKAFAILIHVMVFMILIAGISIFIKEPDWNKYISHTFNIYLFPHALGALDRKFTCQVSI